MADSKIEAAKAHWSGRMVSNGMPLADFQDVTTQTKSWDEWCNALSEKGDAHASLGYDAAKNGYFLSAGEHYVTAAVCYHFGKFLFVCLYFFESIFKKFSTKYGQYPIIILRKK